MSDFGLHAVFDLATVFHRCQCFKEKLRHGNGGKSCSAELKSEVCGRNRPVLIQVEVVCYLRYKTHSTFPQHNSVGQIACCIYVCWWRLNAMKTKFICSAFDFVCRLPHVDMTSLFMTSIKRRIGTGRLIMRKMLYIEKQLYQS